jgi:hypothetical protein
MEETVAHDRPSFKVKAVLSQPIQEYSLEPSLQLPMQFLE